MILYIILTIVLLIIAGSTTNVIEPDKSLDKKFNRACLLLALYGIILLILNWKDINLLY